MNIGKKLGIVAVPLLVVAAAAFEYAGRDEEPLQDSLKNTTSIGDNMVICGYHNRSDIHDSEVYNSHIEINYLLEQEPSLRVLSSPFETASGDACGQEEEYALVGEMKNPDNDQGQKVYMRCLTTLSSSGFEDSPEMRLSGGLGDACYN